MFYILGVNARRCDLSCYFQRYCGTIHKQLYAKTPEECRAICDADASCMVGTWHPPKQIWGDEDRPVCFLFSKDRNAVVGNWGGVELYDYHPGAKMIRCTITRKKYHSVVFSNYKIHNQLKIMGLISLN